MFLINILLVDDHALFSKSLEIALSDYSEIETFDSINDVSQLDNFIVSKKPDIILMDINLKNISCLPHSRSYSGMHPNCD